MPANPPVSKHSASKPLSVTELTARIKQTLETGFSSIEVIGEVSRITRPASGHLYFTIKDAHAAISAVVWRSAALRMRHAPDEGESFIFSGHLSLYEPRGAYQLVVTRIEPVGAGALAAEFERRKQTFSERGWFDPSRKKPLPQLPEQIGIITSETAAALKDVRKVLATRPAWLQLTLAPALVQGAQAPAAIANAIRRISQIESPPDLLLLVRGGGSMEDLWCFNDERVVQAIAECPIPIITGIGHEIDTTLADLAADLRAATPSNAAEHCCPSRAELRERLPNIASIRRQIRQQQSHRRHYRDNQHHRLRIGWQHLSDSRHHHAAQLQSRLTERIRSILREQRPRLSRMEKRLLQHQPTQRLHQQRLLRHTETTLLQQNFSLCLQQQRQALARLTAALKTESRQLHNNRQQWQLLAGRLTELDPTRVLERGYSMNIAADGALITRIDQIAPGDQMRVLFQDGTADTRIESVQPDKRA